MISKDIQGEEDQRFIFLLSKFPKLLIYVYSQIKGEDVIQHHIKLKESIPIGQMLQQSGVVQKEDLQTLLPESFIYHMEDLKCVSPIVLVSKKNDIDFKPLNYEVIVYKRQGSMENVV